MGKQVGFFMTCEDEKNFLAAIEAMAPVKLIYNTFADEANMEIPTLQPVGSAPGDAHLSLFNPRIQAPIEQQFYPSPSYHCVDLLESEVVEFSRSAPFKTWLNDGRLWFEDKASQRRKSDAFLKWANSLLKWIRSHYEKDASGLYVAPQALELSKAGKLQLGPSAEPSLSLEERKRILGIR